MSDSEQDISQIDAHMSNEEEEEDYDLQFAEDDFQFQTSPLRPLPFVFNDITDRVNNSNNNNNNNNSRGSTQNGHSSNPYQQSSQGKPRVLARVQSEELVRALNSISVDKDFIDDFDLKFGTLHPSFMFGSFSSALQKAKSQQKLIIVYIHTEFTTEGLNILLEETVADYIDSNFLFWIGNYSKPSPQLDNLIGEMLPPVMAVVGVDSNGNTNVIEFLHGINNIDILISRLMTVQDNFVLAQQEANREKKMLNQMLENDRLLKLEQEQALLISQEADKRKQEEEEMLRRAIEEQEHQLKLEREKREQDVQEKQKTLPPEPSDPKQSTDVIFRLADGTRLQRKFNRADTVEALYTFVQIKCPELYVQGEGFQLVVSYPKKTLTDHQQTLSAAGLVPQAMIYVQL